MKTDEEIMLYFSGLSEKEKSLWDKVSAFEPLFDDFLFKRDTETYSLTTVQTETGVIGDRLPDVLERFDICQYEIVLEDLDDANGQYSPKAKRISISPAADPDRTLLHEMIHLFEDVLEGLPLYFHDAVMYALYQDLKKKISNLDDIIRNHAHILNETLLYEAGGNHDILFLLKSLSLDISQGYPLGTVFGYGLSEELN